MWRVWLFNIHVILLLFSFCYIIVSHCQRDFRIKARQPTHRYPCQISKVTLLSLIPGNKRGNDRNLCPNVTRGAEYLNVAEKKLSLGHLIQCSSSIEYPKGMRAVQSVSLPYINKDLSNCFILILSQLQQHGASGPGFSVFSMWLWRAEKSENISELNIGTIKINQSQSAVSAFTRQPIISYGHDFFGEVY